MATLVVLLAPGSSGAATAHAAVRMPDLVGRNRAQVLAVMRRDALYFETKGPGSSKSDWVDVLSQSPKPGVVIKWHGEAVLHVTTQSPRGPRPMPNVAGLSRARVFQAMRRAQLYFKTVGSGSSSNKWRLALAQSPRAGTRVAWHSEVTIRVAITRPKAPVQKSVKKAVVKTAPTKTVGRVVNGVGYKIGVATWYSYIPGRCATWYLPKGTRITVHDLATGKSITCIISDREDSGSNRVVDLNETQFAELAPLAQGVINVKVTW
ncbi:MAG TPA: PASTA domain-containing protein [Acidimicrobiales bacterium]|nr:PASTA domain-containing protein [Acidimicrobiales bacterium]